MSAWASPADRAKTILDRRAGMTGGVLIEPESAVDEVFANIEEPDRDMIAAGMWALDELKGVPSRDLVYGIWRSMVRAAQAP